MTDRVLVIDPGYREEFELASGWAVFQGHVLQDAGFSAPWTCTGITTLVLEFPQIYRLGKSKGDPSALLDLAFACGQWQGRHPDAQVIRYRPREWKGSLDKPICHKRARAVLTASEIALIPRLAKTRGGLDVWDAVSLGLVHFGRVRMR